MTNENGSKPPNPKITCGWSPERGPAAMPRSEPWPDRLTMANRDRYRAEFEAAAAARRALLAMQAPLWMRVLALLPNPKAPLTAWVERTKARMRTRTELMDGER